MNALSAIYIFTGASSEIQKLKCVSSTFYAEEMNTKQPTDDAMDVEDLDRDSQVVFIEEGQYSNCSVKFCWRLPHDSCHCEHT